MIAPQTVVAKVLVVLYDASPYVTATADRPVEVTLVDRRAGARPRVLEAFTTGLANPAEMPEVIADEVAEYVQHAVLPETVKTVKTE